MCSVDSGGEQTSAITRARVKGRHLNTAPRTKMPMPISKSSTTMMNRVMVLFSIGGGESVISERRSRRRGGPKAAPVAPGEGTQGSEPPSPPASQL